MSQRPDENGRLTSLLQALRGLTFLALGLVLFGLRFAARRVR